ncbi:MAG: TIGR01906 family membrane protein [Chloroflexi bacterium]|nr:TIGR01906 family membrane protein [Chloroflexota bacterium]
MRLPPVVRTLTKTLVVLAVPGFLLLSNLYFLLTPAYIAWEYSRPGFPPSERYTANERLGLALQTVHYLRSNEDEGYLRSMSTRQGPAYNEREIRHMVDVKAVVGGMMAAQFICGVVMLAGLALLLLDPETRPVAASYVVRGCILLIAFILGVGLVAFLNFDAFFVLFHRMFFEGETWLFAYSDTLIQLFPLEFWMDGTLVLAVLALTEAALLGLAALWLGRRTAGGMGV